MMDVAATPKCIEAAYGAQKERRNLGVLITNVLVAIPFTLAIMWHMPFIVQEER